MKIKNWLSVCCTGGLLLSASSLHAQSSVTLYGVVDVDIDISNQGKGTLATMQGGGLNSSEFGLKGQEDLGGGYKAIFDLENGFSASSGVLLQGGLLFGRQAWVGLTGPVGTLTFGRQYSPEYVANSANDAFVHGLAGGLSNIGRTQNGTAAGLLTAYSITGRTNNSIQYVSPKMGGLVLKVMVAPGGVAGSVAAGSSAGAGFTYTLGTAALNAGYIKNRPASGPGYLESYSAGGTYEIGPAKVFAAYSKDINSTVPSATTRYALENLGLQYRLAASDKILAQGMRVVDTSNGLPSSRNAYIAAIALVHSLSKRTSLYCAYGEVWNRDGSALSLGGAIYSGGVAVPNASARSIQLGMQTVF